MSESGDFLKGFFVGGLIGAGLAFLYAPKSGRELRGEIGDKSRELYDKGRDKAKKLYDEAGGLVQDIKDDVKDHARRFNAGGLVQDVKEDVKDHARNFTKEAKK